MPDIHASITSGRKAVAVAGTREQVIAVSTPCKEVWLSADTENADVIVIGGVDVVAVGGSQKGVVLFAGNPPIKLYIDNVYKLYVDAISNGDAVLFNYLV